MRVKYNNQFVPATLKIYIGDGTSDYVYPGLPAWQTSTDTSSELGRQSAIALATAGRAT